MQAEILPLSVMQITDSSTGNEIYTGVKFFRRDYGESLGEFFFYKKHFVFMDLSYWLEPTDVPSVVCEEINFSVSILQF